MGSGKIFCNSGKYTGTGAAQEIKLGQKPKKITIYSSAGKVEFFEGMSQAAKQVLAGTMTFIGGIEFTEFGFSVSGTDACLNAAATVYTYSAEA